MKLKNVPWSGATIIVAPDDRGRPQQHFVIPLDSLPMWLATINAGKVAEQIRPKLIRYQRECARVLRDHFFGSTTSAPTVSMSDIVAMVREAIAQALPRYLAPPAREVSRRIDECAERILARS